MAAAFALTACDEKPNEPGTTTAVASVTSAASRPPRPPVPTPVPTSSGPEPKAPEAPGLDEVAGAPTVTFAFAPQVETPFTVDTVRVKQRRRGSGPYGGREVLRTVKKVTVTRSDEGYRWRAEPVSFTVHGERTSRVDELVAGFEVSYLLDPSGNVLGVEGYDGLDARANKTLSPHNVKRVGPMLTAEALQRTRASEWRDRMGDLVGRTVSLAEPFVSVSEVPLPKGSATVYGVVRFGPWLQCPALGRCLRVEGYQHTSPEALAALAKVPLETIRAAGEDEDDHDESEPHDHDHGGESKNPKGAAIAMGIHSQRIVDPTTSMAVWERIEREIDLGMAQLSDATTRSYDYPAAAAEPK